LKIEDLEVTMAGYIIPWMVKQAGTIAGEIEKLDGLLYIKSGTEVEPHAGGTCEMRVERVDAGLLIDKRFVLIREKVVSDGALISFHFSPIWKPSSSDIRVVGWIKPKPEEKTVEKLAVQYVRLLKEETYGPGAVGNKTEGDYGTWEDWEIALVRFSQLARQLPINENLSITAAKKTLQQEISRKDFELAHINADKILCTLLIRLGYQEVVDIYRQVRKAFS